jgi:hypothetical protein
VVLLVGVSVLLSCAKQKPKTDAPADGAANGPQAGLALAPEAELAALEAELSARKAELSARGLAFADTSTTPDGGGATPTTNEPSEVDEAAVEPAPKTPPFEHEVERSKDKPSKPGKGKRNSKARKNERKATKRKAVRMSSDDDVDADACAPICRPADAICGLADRICGLAAEHEDEERYTLACERAEDDCARAAQACEECRG